MASFQDKQVGKGREREKIKKIVPMSSYPTRNREFQKIAKQFRQLKNTIMASFQAKIGWERLRKRENKNNRSDEFLPDPEKKIPKKIAKKFKELVLTIMISFQTKIGQERPRNRENKNNRYDQFLLDTEQKITKK